jgi:hypothetical protein
VNQRGSKSAKIDNAHSWNLTGTGIVVADNRLHTTVIELRLKWNGHPFVAVNNISFSICSRRRR